MRQQYQDGDQKTNISEVKMEKMKYKFIHLRYISYSPCWQSLEQKLVWVAMATLWAVVASNNFNYKLNPKLNLSNNWIAIQPQHRRPGQASLRVDIWLRLVLSKELLAC